METLRDTAIESIGIEDTHNVKEGFEHDSLYYVELIDGKFYSCLGNRDLLCDSKEEMIQWLDTHGECWKY